MASEYLREVIYVGERCAYLHIERISVEWIEAGSCNTYRRRADDRIVVVYAVQAKLSLVDQTRGENMLKLEDQVLRDYRNNIVRSQRVLRAPDQSIVDVIADIRCALVRKAII